jgi:hypothetical protein
MRLPSGVVGHEEKRRLTIALVVDSHEHG